MPLRILMAAHALVTKDAATQRGAMRKSNIYACNPARHKSTRWAPASGPIALCTSPCIFAPSPPPEDSKSSWQKLATVYGSVCACVRQRKPHPDQAVYQERDAFAVGILGSSEASFLRRGIED